MSVVTESDETDDLETSSPGYDPDAPPCTHCGSHLTHWTPYHGSYDCHCECCGRVFKSREQRHATFDAELEVNNGE